MNKILVVDNKIIPFDNNSVIADNNSILFKDNGKYYIEYIDCKDVCFNIEVDENVNVNLFEYSNNKNININNRYSLNTMSKLVVSKFYYNDNTNEKIDIYLKDDKTSVNYNFSSITNGSDKYIINIYHKGNNTSSNVINRTIAKEESTNIFDINSYVDNGIKNCYLEQQTKIITLGDSNNKINPNMFIGEESTTAVHSSVIGSVNEEDLFYMMSRGISYKDSINLIIKGMILSNIDVNIEYREKILKLLDDIGGE